MPAHGRYQALMKLADGGSAEVFLAEQLGAAGFKRRVVLKRIRPALYADEQYRQLLVEEAHLAMALHHSNLVEVLDLGEAQGRYFMVLELVDGWTLEQLLKRARAAHVKLPASLAVYLVAEVCRGLSYAHTRTQAGKPMNIVHRDICPNNVMVSDSAEVKLADFGIAKANTRTQTTGVGMVKGKPAFMSPEQACGMALDARSDLFSVGTLLYYLLADEKPFEADTDPQLMAKVVQAKPTPISKHVPSLPPALVKLVNKALKRELEDRFQSAQEMLSALEKVQRSALEPAGRSELEAWLKKLNAKDKQEPASRTLPENLPGGAKSEPEWIELSDEDMKSSGPKPVFQGLDGLPPAGALKGEPPPKKHGWVKFVFFLAVVGSAVWSFKLLDATEAPQPPEQHAVPEKDEKRETVAAASPAKAKEVEPPKQVETADAAVAPSEGADAAVAEAVAPSPAAQVDAGAEAAEVEAGVDAGLPVEPAPVAPPPEPVRAPEPVANPQVKPSLSVSAKIAKWEPTDAVLGKYQVAFDSSPAGAAVMIEKRQLGTTPTAIRFKPGVVFELKFVREGAEPEVRRLVLTERPGKPPLISFKKP